MNLSGFPFVFRYSLAAVAATYLLCGLFRTMARQFSSATGARHNDIGSGMEDPQSISSVSRPSLSAYATPWTSDRCMKILALL
jgi:hypothetical protein